MRRPKLVIVTMEAITTLTMLSIAVNGQTTCNQGMGRVMYERLPNQQLQGFDDDVVRDTAPPFRVLEKCQDLCLRDRSANSLVRTCSSFDFQPGARIAAFGGSAEYEESTCYLTREQAAPEGIGNLMLVPNSVHFNEICLTSNRPERECPSRRYVYERHARKKLKLPSTDLKEFIASNRTECEDKCLNEFSFVCRSASYDASLRTCSLSRFTRRTHPELLEDDHNSDYLENTCLNAERRCDGLAVFVKEENKRLGGPFEADVYSNLTLEECQDMCIRAEKYFCRSVEYDETTKQCIISEEDSVSQKDDITVSSSPTHHFYDLVCLDNPRGSEYPDNSATSHLFSNGRRPDTAFQRYRNSRLGGEFHSEITGRSLSECLDECLRQTSFQCRSAVYSDRFRTCRLSRFNQRDGMRIIYDADYDYYENLMHQLLGTDGDTGSNTAVGRPDSTPGGSPWNRPGGANDRYPVDRYPDDVRYPSDDDGIPIRGGDRFGSGGRFPPAGDRYPTGGDRFPVGGGRYPIEGNKIPIDSDPYSGGRFPIDDDGYSKPVDRWAERPRYPAIDRYPVDYPNSIDGRLPSTNNRYSPYDGRYPSNRYPIDDRFSNDRYPVEKYPIRGGGRYPTKPGRYPSSFNRYPNDIDAYPDTPSDWGRYPNNRYPVGVNRDRYPSGGYPAGGERYPLDTAYDRYSPGGSSYPGYSRGGSGYWSGNDAGADRYPDRGVGRPDRFGGGYGDRPAYPERPSYDDRPGFSDRPVYSDRPGYADRPGYVGDNGIGAIGGPIGVGGGYRRPVDRPGGYRGSIPIAPPPFERPSGGYPQAYEPGYYGGDLGPSRPGAAGFGTRCEDDSFKQVGLHQRMLRPFVRRVTAAQSLAHCQRECIEARDFICRSFNYRETPGYGDVDRDNCELSDRDSRDMELGNPAHFDSGATFDFYERGLGRSSPEDCLDVSQVCNEDGMEFTLRLPEGFFGRIYTYGFYDRCFFRGNGGTVNVLRISGSHGYPECGTQRFGDTMTNIVVVQFSDNVQTGRDKRFNLTCLFRGPAEAVVTSNYIGAGSGSPIPIEYLPEESSLNSKVRLLILYQGRPTTTIAVGDPLTFRLEAQDGYSYATDIFATNVIARDPYSGRSVQLIDRTGCPVDSYVFPELDKGRSSDSLEARFNAFKIPESNFLVFEATVRTCRDVCQPAYCPSGSGRSEPSFGRKKREINSTIEVTEQNVSSTTIAEKKNSTSKDIYKVSYEEAEVDQYLESQPETPKHVRKMIEVFDSRSEMADDTVVSPMKSSSTVCLAPGEYRGLLTAVITLLCLLLTVLFVTAYGYRRYWSVMKKHASLERPAAAQPAFAQPRLPHQRASLFNSNLMHKSFAVPGLSRMCDAGGRTVSTSGLQSCGGGGGGAGGLDDPSEPIYTDPSLFERSRSLRSLDMKHGGGGDNFAHLM